MLIVSFVGRSAIPTPGAGVGCNIWTYRIDSNSSGELSTGQRIALGLSKGVDVRPPELYPGVPQLDGTFVVRDATSSRQFVGRQILSSGTQTLSFVAPASETSYEWLLARGPLGQGLIAVPFITASNTTQQTVQLLQGPVPGPVVFNGRPPTDFTGTLPYASEVSASTSRWPAGSGGRTSCAPSGPTTSGSRTSATRRSPATRRARWSMRRWRRSPSGSMPRRRACFPQSAW